MEKKAFTKFRGVVISSHEVMKSKSFESGVSDVITANAQNISPLVFFFNILVNFMKKEAFTQFYGRSYELTKF